MEKLNNRKLENENNGQLIKRRRSSDYTRCLIGPSMSLLVGSLVEGESRWRSGIMGKWKIRIMAGS